MYNSAPDRDAGSQLKKKWFDKNIFFMIIHIFQVKNSGYEARTMYSVLTKFLGMVIDKTETLHKILNPSFTL